MKDNAVIVDVDGSYLHKKRLTLGASGLLLALMTPPTYICTSQWLGGCYRSQCYNNGPEAAMCHCGHGVVI